MAVALQKQSFSASVWFTDVWTVRSDEDDFFALPGDSGSLVVTEDGEASVGLLFATSIRGDFAYIAPIDTVLDELDLTLISNHGV